MRSGGDIVRLDFAGEVKIARLGSRQLARAGSWKRARRDQLDDGRDAGDGADTFADLVAQPPALFVIRYSAMDQHGRRLLTRRPGDRESCNVAGLEAGQLLDRPFDVLRPVVAPVDDDHV